MSPVIYAAPLSALVVVLGMLLLAVVMVLRRRKRRREVRITARMQSPSLKEAAFFKEEEALHSCPASPLIGNGILEDPLEFPRNRLYIYSNKVLGKWRLCVLVRALRKPSDKLFTRTHKG